MKALTAFLIGLLLAAVSALLGAYFLMIAIGVIHSELLPAVHPVGLATSVILAFLFRAAFSATATTRA